MNLIRQSPVHRSICFSNSDTETVKNFLALYNNKIVKYYVYFRFVGRNSEPLINRAVYEVEDVRSCNLIAVYRRFRGTLLVFQKYRNIENMDYPSLNEEMGSVY